MRVSIISIGDELLKGATINSNAAFIGQELTSIGIIPSSCLTVPDSPEPVVKALSLLLPENDIVISTGGLGPTADDMTKEIIAGHFGLELIEDQETKNILIERWRRLKRGDIPERVITQALVPEGAIVYPNKVGTAPGIQIDSSHDGKNSTVIMLPGPPRELIPMFKDSVIPFIKENMEERVFTKTMHLAGVPESVAEEKIISIPGFPLEKLGLAYCASPRSVRVFLTGKDEETVNSSAAKVEELFKQECLPQGYESDIEYVSALLREKSMTLSSAESCTGGMIAAEVTELAGSSDIFKGSLVVYSNEAKIKMLGVESSVIETKGAVSSECAEQMLVKVQEKFNTDAAIAVTGIAGPGGGTTEKPVGLVYIGVALGDKKIVREYNFPGDRNLVRYRTVHTSMNTLKDLLLGYI